MLNKINGDDRGKMIFGLARQPEVGVAQFNRRTHLPGQFNLFRAGINASDAGVTAAFKPVQETAVAAGDLRDRKRRVLWKPRANDPVVNMGFLLTSSMERTPRACAWNL